MMKHLGHIPTEKHSSNWSVFITNARKEHWGMEFQTDAMLEEEDAWENKKQTIEPDNTVEENKPCTTCNH